MSAKREQEENIHTYMAILEKKWNIGTDVVKTQWLIGIDPVPVVGKTVEQGGTNGQKSGTRREPDEIFGSNCWY